MKKQEKLKKKFKTFFYRILKEFSEKIDNNILKEISDVIFIFIEKIALKFDYFLNLYIKYYEDMTNNEITLTSISKKYKVVHVGCGSIPATSILIYQKTNARIVGIDNNINAVKNAKFCVEKLNLSDKIEIKNAEASDFLFDTFDVIILSQGITLTDELIKKISKNISKDSKIILRTFSDRYGNFLKSDEFIKDVFIVDKKIRHEKQGRIMSVSLSIKN